MLHGTRLVSKGWFWDPPSCKSACIQGFTDWACSYFKNFGNQGIYGGNGQLCTWTKDDGSITYYSCHEEDLTLYEWVCNSCGIKYGQKKQECGKNTIMNWSNETCTGECNLCAEQFHATAERCNGASNIVYWDQTTCEGSCINENFGKMCQIK